MKSKEQLYLDKLHNSIDFLMLILGITTALLGNNIAFEKLSGFPPIVQITGSVFAGFLLWRIVDENLGTVLHQAINKWSGAKVDDRKKRSAKQLTFVACFFLLFSGTLTLMNNTMLVNSVVGKSPVTVSKTMKQKKEIRADGEKLKKTNNASISSQLAVEKDVTESYNKSIAIIKQQRENRIDATGEDFAGFRTDNSYVLNYTGNKRWNEGKIDIKVFDKKILALESEKVEKQNEARNKTQKVRDEVALLNKEITTNVNTDIEDVKVISTSMLKSYESAKDMLMKAFIYIECLIAVLVGIIFWLIVIHLQEHKNLEYKSSEHSIADMLSRGANRISGIFNISGMATVGIVDTFASFMAKHTNYASVANHIDINQYLFEEAQKKKETLYYGSDRSRKRKPTNLATSATQTPTNKENRGVSEETHAPTADFDTKIGQRHSATLSDIKPTKSDTERQSEEASRHEAELVALEVKTVSVTWATNVYQIEIHTFEKGGVVYVKNREGAKPSHITLKQINKSVGTYRRRLEQNSTKANIESYTFLEAAKAAIKNISK